MRTRTTASRVERRRARLRHFRKNYNYFESHKHALLKQFRNQYIAVLNQRVVDTDADQRELMRRVFRTIGREQPVFFTHVTDSPRVFKVPSIKLIAKSAILQ